MMAHYLHVRRSGPMWTSSSELGTRSVKNGYVLKRNKYVGILSIAVTTLQYITISMITIFSMYIVHVHLGSGRNSYQSHVNDSGEFWRVLGCTRIRRH